MSNFHSIEAFVNPHDIAETLTTQYHPFGTRIKAKDLATTAYGQGEFIYLKGASSTVVGSVVVINPDDFTTTLASANAIGALAVSMSINNTTSNYGWYQIYGKGVAKVLSGFADNGNCYLTSTAGSIDDTDVAGDYITGMKGASAIDTPSTGLAEVELSYPFVRDGLDD